MPRSSSPPPRASQPGRVLRGVALTAVSAGVLVLAAAAFVLSYSGIHAIARQAGIPAPLARGYPVILDAMLVIACAAVLALRGAGWVSKCYAWLVLLVLLGAAAAADALHSTSTAIPHRTAAAAAAIIPWVLLLIGFGLLLAILRHFRLHRAPAAATAMPAPEPIRLPGPPVAALPPGQSAAASLAHVAPPVQAAPAPASLPVAVPAQGSAPATETLPPPTAADRLMAGQPVSGQPVSGQPASEAADPRSAAPAPEAAADGWPDDPDPAYLDADADELAAGAEIYAAPPAEDPEDREDAVDEPAEPAGPTGPAGPDPGSPRQPGPQPAFHRMWSSPTPPGDEDEA